MIISRCSPHTVQTAPPGTGEDPTTSLTQGATGRTNEALRPTQPFDEAQAGIFGCKPIQKFVPRAGVVDACNWRYHMNKYSVLWPGWS